MTDEGGGEREGERERETDRDRGREEERTKERRDAERGRERLSSMLYKLEPATATETSGYLRKANIFPPVDR